VRPIILQTWRVKVLIRPRGNALAGFLREVFVAAADPDDAVALAEGACQLRWPGFDLSRVFCCSRVWPPDRNVLRPWSEP